MHLTPRKRLAAAIVFVAFLFCAGLSHAAEWLDALDQDIATLRQGTAKEDRIRLAILLHVKSKYTETKEPLYAEIRGIIGGFKALSSASDEEAENAILEGNPWRIRPEDDEAKKAEADRQALYSGKDEEIVAAFFTDPPQWRVPDIDCRWLEKSPGLFGLHRIVMGGGASAGPLAQIVCDNPPVLPYTVWELQLKLGRQLGTPWDVQGTARLAIGANRRSIADELIYAPQHFLPPDYLPKESMSPGEVMNKKGKYSLFENFYKKPFLEAWGSYSLWNFNVSRGYALEFETAVRDLAGYFKALPQFRDIPSAVVKETARIAVKDLLFPYDRLSYDKPLADAEARKAILGNQSLDKIKPLPGVCSEIKNENQFLISRMDDGVGPPEPLPFIAVMRPDVLAMLFECGHDPLISNRFSKTPLMNAAHFNALDGAKKVLAAVPADGKKAFVNAQTELPFTPDIFPVQALSIQHGNRTALMYAAENASAKFIDWLLAAGAEPCLKDSKGLTALDYMEGRNPAAFTNPYLKKAERKRLKAKLACPVRP